MWRGVWLTAFRIMVAISHRLLRMPHPPYTHIEVYDNMRMLTPVGHDKERYADAPRTKDDPFEPENGNTGPDALAVAQGARVQARRTDRDDRSRVAGDYRAMKRMQSKLSKLSQGHDVRPDVMLLYRLEEIYGLEPNKLDIASAQTARQRNSAANIPLDYVTVAVPDEPELEDAVNAVLQFEAEELPYVAGRLRDIANGPRPLQGD